jgi:hypothetical protein
MRTNEQTGETVSFGNISSCEKALSAIKLRGSVSFVVKIGENLSVRVVPPQ